MLPFQSYYGLGSCSSRDGFSHRLRSIDMIGGSGHGGGGGTGSGGGGSAILTNHMLADKKSMSASKSHSEAEKRRRERINGHLRTLRALLPNTIKSDKASLLAEVVNQVRELKKLANDVAGKEGNGSSSSSSNGFPGETDELVMSYCTESSESASWLIKVTMSCEDRVELLKDVSQAVKSVRGRVVKAEMSTIGGRTKSQLVIERRGNGGGEEEYLNMLRRALKSVVDKPGVSGTSQMMLGNKRQRLCHQHYQS